jgi:formylmethanofuran dehydrogenase subunit E
MKCTKCGKDITWEKYLCIVDDKPVCQECYKEEYENEAKDDKK